MLNKPGAVGNADTPKRLCLYIGENIRQARSRQGTSLAGLGEALGIEASLVADYEAGLEKISPSMLCRIAATLDTTLGSLFGMPGT